MVAGSTEKPELRGEPRRAQHAQRVLLEALARVADRTDHARLDVGLAAEQVDDLLALHGDGVDGEVAPREVGREIVEEDDLGLAGVVGVDLRAKRRDLDEAPVGLEPHRPVLLADEVGLAPGLRAPPPRCGRGRAAS